MEQQKYTFKYIHMADGFVENAMQNLNFAMATLRYCIKSEKEKDEAFRLYSGLRSFISSLCDLESKNFASWKKDHDYGQER